MHYEEEAIVQVQVQVMAIMRHYLQNKQREYDMDTLCTPWTRYMQYRQQYKFEYAIK